jgi:glutathione synthase
MATEAHRRGHKISACMIEGLSLHGDRAWGNIQALGFDTWPEPTKLVRVGASQRRDLAGFDVVLMRKDPPVDSRYITATWILDRAGTLVVNDPRGLRELNEKLAVARFADLAPKSFVSTNPSELREFLRVRGGKMIVKPVYGFGGREILLVREGDPNVGSLLELATSDGTRWTIAQEYLEEATSEGDKRILLVDGEPVGAVLRVLAQGELRNNFHAGGRPAPTQITDNDRAICSRIAPCLRDLGQVFVGIDVIGTKLTEINVTSPTGMQEINRLEGWRDNNTVQARFWDKIESMLGEGRRT